MHGFYFGTASFVIHKITHITQGSNEADSIRPPATHVKDNKDDAFIDRLMLNKDRLQGICNTLSESKSFEDPIGKVLASWDRPNGLNISRVATPLGVIGLIFEMFIIFSNFSCMFLNPNNFFPI